MNLFDQFHSTVLFSISFCLYGACVTHLFSSILSCNLCLRYCDQLFLLNEEINANVFRHSLWEYSKRFHGSFEWHLTPHMTLSIETCNSWAPCIKDVRLIQVLLYLETCLVTQNYCEECRWCALIAVFSLNFSSAGNRARLSEKNLGASWPLSFHFWSPGQVFQSPKIIFKEKQHTIYLRSF